MTLPVPARTKLPVNREGLTHVVRVGNFDMTITVNFYPNSAAPGEVFIYVATEGSTIAGTYDALATTISVALQHGVPWPVLSDKYRGHKFQPDGGKTIEQIASEVAGNPLNPFQEYTSMVHAVADAIDYLVGVRAKKYPVVV